MCLDFLHGNPFLRNHLRGVRALHSNLKRPLIIPENRFSCHESDVNLKSFGFLFTQYLTALNADLGILIVC